MTNADELQKLFELKNKGVITEEEFEQQKSIILSSSLKSVQPISEETRSKKVIAGVAAITLGSFGIHKFILGYTKVGVIMLAATVLTCGLAAIILHPIALVEGVLYLVKSDLDFEKTYILQRREWF